GIHRRVLRVAAAITLAPWHSRASQASAVCRSCRSQSPMWAASRLDCLYSRGMDRTTSCWKWRRQSKNSSAAEQVVAASEGIFERSADVRSARPGASVDTIFQGLNFFVHDKNERFCLWKRGRKRVRLARARILVGSGTGTLD